MELVAETAIGGVGFQLPCILMHLCDCQMTILNRVVGPKWLMTPGYVEKIAEQPVTNLLDVILEDGNLHTVNIYNKVWNCVPSLVGSAIPQKRWKQSTPI